MVQCVAVSCSVLQCVAVCCSVLQCMEVLCSLLQYLWRTSFSYAQFASQRWRTNKCTYTRQARLQNRSHAPPPPPLNFRRTPPSLSSARTRVFLYRSARGRSRAYRPKLPGESDAMHCHALQHTATHCNTLQHAASPTAHNLRDCEMPRTATHCYTLQHTATHCDTVCHLSHTARLQDATHSNTLRHTATHRFTCQTKPARLWDGLHCHTLPHTATHCHTLPHTATHCHTLRKVSHVAHNP